MQQTVQKPKVGGKEGKKKPQLCSVVRDSPIKYWHFYYRHHRILMLDCVLIL